MTDDVLDQAEAIAASKRFADGLDAFAGTVAAYFHSPLEHGLESDQAAFFASELQRQIYERSLAEDA